MKKKDLILNFITSDLSVTYSKDRPINSTVRVVYISVYPHYVLVCCMQLWLSWWWLRWCFLPVKSLQLFSWWRMHFVCRVPLHVHVCLSSKWGCLSPSFGVFACVCARMCACSFPLQHADIIKQLAQSFQPQQGQIIQSALSSNTVWIHYWCSH